MHKDERPDELPVYARELGDNGRAFMEMFQTRPDWENELREVAEAGTPLLDEVIYCSRIGPEPETYCVFPVVDGGEIVRLAFFRLTPSDPATRGADGPQLEAPEIMDERAVNENMYARALVDSKVVADWANKGYELAFKVSEPEEVHVHREEETPITGVRYMPETWVSHPFVTIT